MPTQLEPSLAVPGVDYIRYSLVLILFDVLADRRIFAS